MAGAAERPAALLLHATAIALECAAERRAGGAPEHPAGGAPEHRAAGAPESRGAAVPEPRAVLIRGPSGAGKSDLALRCLTLGLSPLVPYPARLVADDQVELTVSASGLMASAPAALHGLIEVRGLGIVKVPATTGPVPVRLVVDLSRRADIPRLPDPRAETVISGHRLPRLLVDPFEAAAAQKVLLALLSAAEPGSSG